MHSLLSNPSGKRCSVLYDSCDVALLNSDRLHPAVCRRYLHLPRVDPAAPLLHRLHRQFRRKYIRRSVVVCECMFTGSTSIGCTSGGSAFAALLFCVNVLPAEVHLPRCCSVLWSVRHSSPSSSSTVKD